MKRTGGSAGRWYCVAGSIETRCALQTSDGIVRAAMWQAGLGAGIVERVPVGPGLDLGEQCRARTLRAADLAVAHQLVLCRH